MHRGDEFLKIILKRIELQKKVCAAVVVRLLFAIYVISLIWGAKLLGERKALSTFGTFFYFESEVAVARRAEDEVVGRHRLVFFSSVYHCYGCPPGFATMALRVGLLVGGRLEVIVFFFSPFFACLGLLRRFGRRRRHSLRAEVLFEQYFFLHVVLANRCLVLDRPSVTVCFWPSLSLYLYSPLSDNPVSLAVRSSVLVGKKKS